MSDGANPGNARRSPEPLQQASMSLKSSTSGGRSGSGFLKRAKSSPLRVPPPFQAPMIDREGWAKFQVYRPPHAKGWDRRFVADFTKTGDRRAENDLIQTGLRTYFERPQTEQELKSHLQTLGGSGASLLKALEGPEPPKKRTSPICPDGNPSNIPTRHAVGGSMKDGSNQVRPWNERWGRGTHTMNDELHISHRTYFSKESLFDTSPSQRWRRYRDQEYAPGDWREADAGPKRFGPMGV